MSLVTVRRIPIWLKIAHSAFVAVLVPVYWRQYGPGNFLWFSDVALLATVPALWFEHRLTAEHAGRCGPRAGNAVDHRLRHARRDRKQSDGISRLHVRQNHPLNQFVRCRCFIYGCHRWLVWIIAQLGYDPRAWHAQAVVTTVLLPVTYALTRPEENVNWVYGAGTKPQTRVHPRLYLVGVMLFFPLVFQLPAHALLQRLFGVG